MAMIQKIYIISLLLATFSQYCISSSAEGITRQKEPTGRLEYFNVDPDDAEQFHSLVAKTWKGKTKYFEDLEGYVTIVANLHWNWSDVRANLMKLENIHSTYPYVSEFLVFPTNVPCTGDDEETFREKTLTDMYDWKISIMETTSINGEDTHPVYKYLKRITGVDTLEETYATYFFISPDGNQITKADGLTLDMVTKGISEYIKMYL